VLVAQRGTGCRVAEAGHQVGQRGAGCGGQRGAGMPQVVPAQVRPAGRRPRRVEVPKQSRARQLVA
jgi:hypothetical protein